MDADAKALLEELLQVRQTERELKLQLTKLHVDRWPSAVKHPCLRSA